MSGLFRVNIRRNSRLHYCNQLFRLILRVCFEVEPLINCIPKAVLTHLQIIHNFNTNFEIMFVFYNYIATLVRASLPNYESFTICIDLKFLFQLTTDYQLPTTYYLLPTTYYLLPTTYYQLPTTNYLLPTTNYLLPTTYYQLPTNSSLLSPE